jgi:hypothetical protein
MTLSTHLATQSDLPPGAAHLVAFVNGRGDRYSSLCVALVAVLAKVKLSREDMQDVLSDISDVLDGIPPSPKSGLSAKRR